MGGDPGFVQVCGDHVVAQVEDLFGDEHVHVGAFRQSATVDLGPPNTTDMKSVCWDSRKLRFLPSTKPLQPGMDEELAVKDAVDLIQAGRATEIIIKCHCHHAYIIENGFRRTVTAID